VLLILHPDLQVRLGDARRCLFCIAAR
jgi:hypothetical protein